MCPSANHMSDPLTLAQAVKTAGVSEKTLRRWIKSGRLTAELVEGTKGKEYRVNADDLSQAQKLSPLKSHSEPQPATVDASLDPSDLATLKALAEGQTAMIEALRLEVRNLADQNHDLTAQVSQLQDRVLKALPAPVQATRPTLLEKLKGWLNKSQTK